MHAYEPEEYGRKKTFLTDDGLAGVAVAPDGDIVSVFKDPRSKARGVATRLLLRALAEGFSAYL